MLRRNIKQGKWVESAMEGQGGGVVILRKRSGKTSPRGSEGENPVLPGGSAFQGKRNGSAKALRQNPGQCRHRPVCGSKCVRSRTSKEESGERGPGITGVAVRRVVQSLVGHSVGSGFLLREVESIGWFGQRPGVS